MATGMEKDLKIGVVAGLILLAVVAIWLSTRPCLSTKARMLHNYNSTPEEIIIERPDPVADSPNLAPAGINDKQTRVTDPENHQRPQIAEMPKFHTVREGETLSDISHMYYGTASKWQKIARRNAIKNADRLKPGTKLVIPQ